MNKGERKTEYSSHRVIENVELLDESDRLERSHHSSAPPPSYAPFLSQPAQDYAPPGPHSGYGIAPMYAPSYGNAPTAAGSPIYYYGLPPYPPASDYSPYSQQPPNGIMYGYVIPSPQYLMNSETSSGDSLSLEQTYTPAGMLSLDDIEDSFNKAIENVSTLEVHHDATHFVDALHPLKRENTMLMSNKGSPEIGYGSTTTRQPPIEIAKGAKNRSMPPPRSQYNNAPVRNLSPRHYNAKSDLAVPAHHRRVNSDDPTVIRQHRRTASEQQQLDKSSFYRRTAPPRVLMDRTKTDLLKNKRRNPMTQSVQRNRSVMVSGLSESDVVDLGTRFVSSNTSCSPKGRPPQHRRGSSIQGSIAESVATDMSMASFVSDVRKSTYFSGYNDAGEMQFSFQVGRVHLVMDKSLPLGRVYQVPIQPFAFDEYHQVAEDISLGLNDPEGGACGCDCAHCVACHGKRELLPANYYAITVQDDLYRRVVDEICSSRSMPCGVFFCGHHEDVSRPSLLIPVAVVISFFLWMGIVAYLVNA